MHKVSLGTMVMGDQLNQEESVLLVSSFLGASAKCSEIDTAYMYPVLEEEGKTESMLGSMGTIRGDQLSTKANAGTVGGLSSRGVREQLEGSLKRLNVPSIDIFWLHWPDHKVDILETLSAVASLHREGKFKRFGLSNYSAWMVVRIWHLCNERAWVLPTLYQGMYNCLTRTVESELLPALRQYGIAFYAYNITAGGLLSGNKESARFTTAKHAERYKKRYINKGFLAAVEKLHEVCAAESVSPIDAGIRWLVWHSKLDRNKDVLIVGASKLSHLDANLQSALSSKPLPDNVVTAMDACAELARPEWSPYHR